MTQPKKDLKKKKKKIFDYVLYEYLCLVRKYFSRCVRAFMIRVLLRDFDGERFKNKHKIRISLGGK